MSIIDNLFGTYDMYLLKFFNQPFSVFLNIFFIVLIYSIYPILILLAFFYMRTKQFEKLSHLFLVVVLGYLFVIGLKYYFDRPRPYENHPELAKIFEKIDPSFPSAHTFLSFLVLYFIPKRLPKWIKYIFILYLIVLIPIGVLYAGVHYPSDVAFGAIIGLLFPKIISEGFARKVFKF